MSKYPRLAALRAQRERQEAEIAEPYLTSMLRAQREAATERAAREGLERIMSSKFAPQMFEHLAHDFAEGAKRHIMGVVRSAYPKGGVVSLEFLSDELRWADPDTLARRVVDHWKRECGPKIRFLAVPSEEDMKLRVTTVQVSIPELHYRHQMVDETVW